MDVFMEPYNKKVWAYPPEMMNCKWVGERVAAVDVKKVIYNLIYKKEELSWGPNSIFKFPKKGGTGEIWTSLAKLIKEKNSNDVNSFSGLDIRGQESSNVISLNSKLIKIDPIKKIATYLKDLGSSITKEINVKYTHLISTIPLDILSTLCGLVPKEPLLYSSTHVIGIGIKGETPKHLKTKCWMYFPEDNCPFYRVTIFSNYSKFNCPDGTWSLMCEISESRHKPVNVNTIIKDTIDGCINTGLLTSSKDIISTFHTRLEYGYPTPFLNRDNTIQELFDKLEKYNIKSRGRFGAWKYEVSNQDHSLMQGVEAIDNILYGKDEITFTSPEIVNK